MLINEIISILLIGTVSHRMYNTEISWLKTSYETKVEMTNLITLYFSFLSFRKFFILNPTNTAYSFHWTNEDISDPHGPLTTSHFTCLTTHGVIEAGKKHEIVFEFVPETTELIESFWRFFIPEQNVSMPFLLVGTSSEPAISLDRSHVNFKELLLGELV